MTNPAQLARLRKEAHPEQYCTHKGCLWRVAGPRGPNPCRNHPVATPRIDLDEFVRSVMDGVIGDEPSATSAGEFCDTVERLLVARAGRPLNVAERFRVYIAAGPAWNRRQEAAREEAYERSEWLADFQAGDHV